MNGPLKSPTMADVARAVGVSPMTVSRAFRRDGTVSAETRARVLSAAETLGYVFDRTASNLKSQRSGFVAVTIPSLNNANFADTVRGLTEGLMERDLQVLLGFTDYDLDREEVAIEQLLRRRPEAIVLTGGMHTERARARLTAARIPVVESWDLPADPIGHVVGFSNAAAMEALVQHLVDRSRTRIAFIGGDSERDARGADRRRGFLAAMEARGLSPHRLLDTGAPPVTLARGAEAMTDLLARWPDTNAVIGVSDLAAFGALSLCQRRGIAVPDEIALAGFGAYDISDVAVPSITTMEAHAERIGRAAADLLIELLEGRAGSVRRIELAPTLLPRESTQAR